MATDIEYAIKNAKKRLPAYRNYSDYYRGIHRLAFATQKFATTFGDLFTAFADNLCPAVCDSTADRLQITAFGVDDDQIGESDAAGIVDDLWAIWKRNRMIRRSGETHLNALRDGDSYLIIWPDADGRATIYPNKAENIFVAYDAERPGVLVWAAKIWSLTNGAVRLNMYYPDRIERYISPDNLGGQIPDNPDLFTPYQTETIQPQTANPYGVVPVFHFANNAGVGEMGQSELSDVIPLQDALNKSIADMLVAMEFVALPQRWVAGIDLDYDEETGQLKTPFVPGIDRIWAVAAESARFGEFMAANLQQFIAVSETFRTEVARVSRTPLHYLMLQGGSIPSGESLKTVESPFVTKVKDRMGGFGDVWSSAMTFAYLVETDRTVMLSTDWADPESKSMKESAETAQIKRNIGVSLRMVLKELGYTQSEIDAILVDLTNENARIELARAAVLNQDAALTTDRPTEPLGDQVTTQPQ